jgi:hypothetical protein
MISAFKHIRLSGYNLTPVSGQAWDGSSQLRLGFSNSGLAYYSELTGISGYLQSLIQTADSNVDSINGLTGAVNITGGDGISIQVNSELGQITVVGNSGYFQGLINNLTGNFSTLSGNLIATGNFLSDNLISTGNTLSQNIASTGNTLSQNIASTGNTLSQNIASTGSSLSQNLATTGSILQTNINNFSGYVNATYVTKTSNQVFTTPLTPGSDSYTINYPVVFGSTPKVQATLEVAGDVMYNLSIKSINPTGYVGLLSDNVLENDVSIHTFASTQ